MKAYHFTNGTKLRDGRDVPPIGEWLEHEGPIVPCSQGLHASEHPFDALMLAPGNMLHLVELDGEIIAHGSPIDKLVGRRRKIIATIDAEQLTRDFARWCASQVLHLWNAPDIVKEYLATGDESKRAAAWDAAWAAARDAARAAAWAATWAAAWAAARAAALDAAKAAARDAAKAATWDTAWDAAWDTAKAATWDTARAAARAAAWAATWDTARDAAWDTARDAQRAKFLDMVEAAFADQQPKGGAV
jgi:hypothetical protein